jgi:ribonuclease VapC
VVIDSSALVAAQLKEPGWEFIIKKIESSPLTLVGGPTLLETVIVLTHRIGSDAHSMLAMFLRHFRIQVVPFTEEHFDIAADAFLKYGKGRHPAALNFGDCMSYAIANLSGLPLLYTGNDFAQTDIQSA